jgi:hypothetical protein
MTFKPGDTVIVIRLEHARYPPAAPPGTIATINQHCSCLVSAMLGDAMYAITTEHGAELCAQGQVLRRIDPEGRKVVKWEIVPWQPEPVRTPA